MSFPLLVYKELSALVLPVVCGMLRPGLRRKEQNLLAVMVKGAALSIVLFAVATRSCRSKWTASPNTFV